MQRPSLALTREQQKLATLEHQKQNEQIHQLVVKIISWKSGAGASSPNSAKITPKEWSSYKKHILTISKIESPERIKSKLEAVKEAIQNRDGFA